MNRSEGQDRWGRKPLNRPPKRAPARVRETLEVLEAREAAETQRALRADFLRREHERRRAA